MTGIKHKNIPKLKLIKSRKENNKRRNIFLPTDKILVLIK